MPIPTEHVQAGDLIRAEVFNDIIDALADLNTRLAALEGAPVVAPPGAVQITSISPATPRVREEMTINGLNFEHSVNAAVVRLNTTTVPSFKPGSSDTRLVFDVPDVPGVTTNPTDVLLSVSNFTTTATRQVTLLPRAQATQGRLDVGYVSASPSPLAPGSTALIVFEADWNGESALPVLLDATVSTNWGPIDIMSDTSPPQPFQGRQTTVPAGGSRRFIVRFPIPSNAAQGTNFTVTARASGQGKTGSFTQAFQVNQPPPQQDDKIELEYSAILDGRRDGPRLFVPASTTAVLSIDAQFKEQTDYDLTVTVPAPSAGWTAVSGVRAPTSTEPSIRQSELTFGSDGIAHKTVDIDVTAPASSSAQAQLQISAKRRGQTIDRDLNFDLRVGN